jgi:hypothetical protein
VSGGVDRQNGKAFLLPWGLSRDAVRDDLRAQLKKRGIPFDEITLQTIGDGRYQVNAGMGPLSDAGGSPVVLTVSRGTLVRDASGRLTYMHLPGESP